MECSEALRTQAYFDGELDASSVLEVERHLDRCPSCRDRLQDLDSLRTALRQLSAETAPPELRHRIDQVLDQETQAGRPQQRPRHRSASKLPGFWIGAFSGIATSAAAALAAFFILRPVSNDVLLHDLTADQQRSLMASHLIDVVSTDQHTVKPWFAGRADVSPVVADFEPQGYRLVGGRSDYLDSQRAAVIVYRHGAHVINVFAWRAGSGALPSDSTRHGYHMAFWRSGDLAYCAISDTGWAELHALRQLLQQPALGG